VLIVDRRSLLTGLLHWKYHKPKKMFLEQGDNPKVVLSTGLYIEHSARRLNIEVSEARWFLYID